MKRRAAQAWRVLVCRVMNAAMNAAQALLLYSVLHQEAAPGSGCRHLVNAFHAASGGRCSHCVLSPSIAAAAGEPPTLGPHGGMSLYTASQTGPDRHGHVSPSMRGGAQGDAERRLVAALVAELDAAAGPPAGPPRVAARVSVGAFAAARTEGARRRKRFRA